MAGWLLSSVVDWETGQWKMPRDPAEAERLNAGKMVEETLSWLVAAEKLAKARRIQLIVALIPFTVCTARNTSATAAAAAGPSCCPSRLRSARLMAASWS